MQPIGYIIHKTITMQHEPLMLERTFNAPANRVWKAITDVKQMKEWYFDLDDFKPEIGFEFSFTGGDEKEQFTHRCKITELVPGKKLTYSWRYEGYDGNSFVTFELFPEGSKTRLKLTHAGLDTFPPIQSFARENFLQGWTAIIGTNLKAFVEKPLEQDQA